MHSSSRLSRKKEVSLGKKGTSRRHESDLHCWRELQGMSVFLCFVDWKQKKVTVFAKRFLHAGSSEPQTPLPLGMCLLMLLHQCFSSLQLHIHLPQLGVRTAVRADPSMSLHQLLEMICERRHLNPNYYVLQVMRNNRRVAVPMTMAVATVRSAELWVVNDQGEGEHVSFLFVRLFLPFVFCCSAYQSVDDKNSVNLLSTMIFHVQLMAILSKTL